MTQIKNLVDKGNNYLDNNDLPNALKCFDKVAKKYPNFSGINQIHKVRMFILERMNSLNKAYKLCNKFKNINDPGLQRVRAIVLKRKGYINDALVLAHNILQRKDLDQKSNQELHFLIADIYDKKDEQDKAIKFFNKANDIIRNSPENSEFDKNNVLNFIELMKDNFLDINSQLFSNDPNYPIFLIGFPRSGTTLLNAILNCHNEISCIDEKPTFSVDKKGIINDGDKAIKFFKNLDKKQIKDMQIYYWNEAYKFAKKNDLVIDKLPLRFIDVGILNKIFPNAKYIFLVRHPLDCILSCFMQNFFMNDSMANFYTLEESAYFYRKSMKLWKQYYENLDLDIHYVYYENLIENFEEETKKLTNFLDMNFDENMLNYYKQKQDVNTPSYNQIIRKPYNDSILRYKKYENYIENIKGEIDEFVKWFGY